MSLDYNREFFCHLFGKDYDTDAKYKGVYYPEDNPLGPELDVDDTADGFIQYFTGKSYLVPVLNSQVSLFNVTFELGCRNNWHIHYADQGGGQILICGAGQGYYQEWGKAAIEMKPGDCINIPRRG